MGHRWRSTAPRPSCVPRHGRWARPIPLHSPRAPSLGTPRLPSGASAARVFVTQRDIPPLPGWSTSARGHSSPAARAQLGGGRHARSAWGATTTTTGRRPSCPRAGIGSRWSWGTTSSQTWLGTGWICPSWIRKGRRARGPCP